MYICEKYFIKEKTRPISIKEEEVEPVEISPLYEFPRFGEVYREKESVDVPKIESTNTVSTGTGKIYTAGEKELFKQDLYNAYFKSLKKLGIDDARAIEFAKRMTSQAALESKWGQSTLAKDYNFGGIKDFRKNTDAAVKDTTEYINGQAKTVKQPFRKFNSIEEFTDYKVNMSIIKSALSQDPKNYYSAIQSGKMKYATDPNYVSKMERMYRSMWK